MNLSPFFRQPVVWLGAIGLVLLGVLAFWYVRRPTDANGNSLILSNRDERTIRRDLSQQAARRRQDSLRAVRADTAAAARYREGQQDQNAALRLHQRARQAAATGDTSARQLQRELSNY